MATLADLFARIRRVLGDSEETFYSDEILTDAVAGAHDALLPYHPKPATQTYTSIATTQMALPSDFYGIDGLLDTDSGKFLPRVRIAPGEYVGNDIKENSWTLHPEGYITLSGEPSDGDFRLYYQAKWSMPTDEADAIEVPTWLHDALVYRACAYALIPESLSSAEISTYDTRLDSGNPEHNPVGRQVNFFLDLFHGEVHSHEPYNRGEI